MSADVIIHPTGYERTATGLYTQSAKPLVDALRWLQSANKQVAEVRGAHGGFSVCDDPKKSGTVAPFTKGTKMVPIQLVKGSADAEIGSVQFWTKGGNPGPFAVHGVAIRASNLAKFCLLVSQQLNFPDLALDLQGVDFRQWSSQSLINLSAAKRRLAVGDGPVKGGYLWSVRAQGRVRSIRVKKCNADGPGEWFLYCDDFEEFVECNANTVSDCGRGMFQGASRQFEDKGQKVPTTLAATPASAHFQIDNNAVWDCGSYPDPLAKGGWMANGSAITVAGIPCDGEITRNRVRHSHVGGGGISVWHDKPKVGNHLTHDGFATGDVRIEDNVLELKSGAAAGREAVQVGGCRSLVWRNNQLTGTERRVVLNHTAPIGKVVDLDGTLP